MRADRGTGRRTDCRHPARIFLRGVLRLLVHRVGITRCDQSEGVIGVDTRHRDFVSDRTEMHRDSVGERGADAVAHLGMIAIDRDLAVGRQFDTPQRTIGAGAIVLGHTRNAGTDEHARRRGRFLLRALLPDRMLLELVEDFSGADRNAVGITGHGPALGRERIAPPELDRIKRQGGRHFVNQRLQRRHRLQRAVTAHRSRGHAARMNGNRGHVDLRHIIDADRGGRADGCHIDREIGQAAAIENVVRSESLNFSASPDRPRSATAS